MEANIKVIVVEDHEETSLQLKMLIDGSPGMKCLGIAETPEFALNLIQMHCPTLVVVDIELKNGASGRELISRIKIREDCPKVLAFTFAREPQEIFEILESGADGYLVKPSDPIEILGAIRELCAGGCPMSSVVARLVVDRFHSRGKVKSALKELTIRESEILKLLAYGSSYEEIAGILKISRPTVSTHVHHILKKLQVSSRAEAAARFFESN